MELNPLAIRHNIGIDATERLVMFCFPGLKVKAIRNKHADICIPNLRSLFEKENKAFHLYESFEDFIDALKLFIPAEISEDGIYTNINYHRMVFVEVIKRIRNGGDSTT